MKIAALALLAAATAVPASAPTKTVTAIGETAAVASARDAADDPAIWRDPAHPERSLIVATDKQLGLNVYGLDGRLRSTLAAGRVNNVDLRVVGSGQAQRIIVGASDRTDVANAHLALFELNPRSGELTRVGRFPLGAGEAYGFCLYQPARGPLYAFVVNKDGAIAQARIGLSATPTVEVVRHMKLATQSEGCVADDRTGMLYVGEEDVGVWRFSAAPAGSPRGVKVAAVDGRRLVADVEGVAIAAQGRSGGWLVVSSQGDSAYAVYRLPGMAYAGRFRIGPGRFGATSDTDGIEIATTSFGGALAGGLMVAQDGDNAPAAQNFKLVRWADVKRAVGLR